VIRKMLVVGGGAALMGLVFVGRDALSYLRTSAGYVTDAVQESVPIEFQIDRARGMVRDLVPEVRKNMHVIAKEEVEVQRLDEQIADTESRLAKEKEQLLRLKTDLASGNGKFQYGGRSYTADEVKADLANRFDRYKTGEATLASLKDIRQARQKSLTAARQKLEGMLAAKRQLQVEVENLEARLQMIAAAKTTSDYQFDDSRLGRVKELVSNLRNRLEVAERLVNAEVYYHDEIPLDKAVPANIVEQIGEHFAPQATTPGKVAKK
jgi:peptidoglycan hydrolase CwlO-like protein